MITPTYTNRLGLKLPFFVLIFIFCSGIYAQKTFTLSGVITDDTGESLIGAPIVGAAVAGVVYAFVSKE